MEVTDEEFGGKLVILRAGDRLKAVPRSHRKLVTPEIEAWWADPVAAARDVADRAASPRMAEWFRAMADRGEWRLELHKADHGAARAGYWLSGPDDIRGAEVGPPETGASLTGLPADLAAFYRLIGFIDWMGFGAAGGLIGAGEHLPLSEYGYDGLEIEPDRSFVFGWSPGGAVLIYTSDGRAGWFSMASSKVHLLGSVRDTIDWVFGELLADRCPDFDYSWV